MFWALQRRGGNKLEVPAMLFKWLWKGNWDEGGLMKYLRFRLKGEVWKTLQQKGSAEGPHCPGAWRKQGPGLPEMRGEPILSRDVQALLTAVLPLSHPATSPLPLWAFESGDFTASWLHSNGFVFPARRPCPFLTISSHSLYIIYSSHQPTHPHGFLFPQNDK